MKKHGLFELGLLGGVALFLCGGGMYNLNRVARIGSAYKAKVLCSGIFVSGRDAAVLEEEVRADGFAVLGLFGSQVDYDSKTVTTSFFSLGGSKAIFRSRLGCTLASDVPEEALRRQPNPPPERTITVAEAELPRSAGSARLSSIVEEAFSEPDPNRLRRTRAVVVVHDGRIVAEKYAPGITPDTPLPGWSMTKSVVNALAGILVREGKLALDGPVPVPEWTAEGDRRAGITLDHLLRMSSGLEFGENYKDPLADVQTMLFASADAGGYAARKPLRAESGKHWQYASGTTNILCRAMRFLLGDDEEYLSFPRRALFDPLGMTSAVLEPDPSGTFIGSSMMHATARDWARFGLLYLQDGVWRGKRILPEGWVRYSSSPAPSSPGGEYGAHFWRIMPHPFGNGVSLPDDTFHASGFQGQVLTIIPSREVVVVRLGVTMREGAWNHPAFIARILKALPPDTHLTAATPAPPAALRAQERRTDHGP